MTTEDDFHLALDRRPRDFHCRLVFADWLEERDDPRAEGYRALGALRKRPIKDPWLKGSEQQAEWRLYSDLAGCIPKGPDDLPGDWFMLISRQSTSTKSGVGLRWWSRREAEDAAALAFSKLPADRRQELLAGVPTA
jgi:uncharacterized protein (TIGR02996 family)